MFVLPPLPEALFTAALYGSARWVSFVRFVESAYRVLFHGVRYRQIREAETVYDSAVKTYVAALSALVEEHGEEGAALLYMRAILRSSYVPSPYPPPSFEQAIDDLDAAIQALRRLVPRTTAAILWQSRVVAACDGRGQRRTESAASTPDTEKEPR